jgi:hypothetical protein
MINATKNPVSTVIMPLYFHASLDRVIFINLVFARTAVKASPAACETRAVKAKTTEEQHAFTATWSGVAKSEIRSGLFAFGWLWILGRREEKFHQR